MATKAAIDLGASTDHQQRYRIPPELSLVLVFAIIPQIHTVPFLQVVPDIVLAFLLETFF